MERPTAVLITGPPGSGKSTLGHEVATQLRLPFIARDDMRGGLLFSAGAWRESLERIPTGEEAVEIFLTAVEGLLTNGVSCVVEYIVRGNRPQDLDRITAVSDCVVVMTDCEDSMERVRERNMTDRLVANEALLKAAGFASVDDHTDALVDRMHEVHTQMRTTFALPVLEVDTTNGYSPGLEQVLTFIITATN